MSSDGTQVFIDSSSPFDAPSEIAQRQRLIGGCIDVMIGQTKIGQTWVEGYKEIARLLETVPLGSNDFNLAKLRLKHALDYCKRGEYGAAAFELRLIRTHLGNP
jgi:hypothetical protein